MQNSVGRDQSKYLKISPQSFFSAFGWVELKSRLQYSSAYRYWLKMPARPLSKYQRAGGVLLHREITRTFYFNPRPPLFPSESTTSLGPRRSTDQNSYRWRALSMSRAILLETRLGCGCHPPPHRGIIFFGLCSTLPTVIRFVWD